MKRLILTALLLLAAYAAVVLAKPTPIDFFMKLPHSGGVGTARVLEDTNARNLEDGTTQRRLQGT